MVNGKLMNYHKKNGYQLNLPFMHGYDLGAKSEAMYKCTDFYAPDSSIPHWDSCAIDWPLGISPIISKKDSDAKNLADLKSPFIFGVNS